MKNGAVIAVIAALAVGGGAGLLWAKLQRARAVEVAPAEVTEARDRAAAAVGPSVQLLKEQLQLSSNAVGDARATVPPVPSPADLQKRVEVRARLMQIHRDVADELQLTPEEAEQFFDLLARQQQQVSELTAAGRSGNEGAMSQRQLSDLRTIELSDDAEQAAMLGGKYPDWLKYQQAELQQNPLEQLQRVLVLQGSNLASDRLDQLAAALTAEQKQISKDKPHASAPRGDDPWQLLQLELQYASTNRQQMLKVASVHLDPQQLAVYQQLLEQRTQAAQRLLRTMEREAGD